MADAVGNWKLKIERGKLKIGMGVVWVVGVEWVLWGILTYPPPIGVPL